MTSTPARPPLAPLLALAYILAAVALAVGSSLLSHRGTPEVLGGASVPGLIAAIVAGLLRRRGYTWTATALGFLLAVAGAIVATLYGRLTLPQ